MGHGEGGETQKTLWYFHRETKNDRQGWITRGEFWIVFSALLVGMRLFFGLLTFGVWSFYVIVSPIHQELVRNR